MDTTVRIDERAYNKLLEMAEMMTTDEYLRENESDKTITYGEFFEGDPGAAHSAGVKDCMIEMARVLIEGSVMEEDLQMLL